jgi:acyl carrier protein
MNEKEILERVIKATSEELRIPAEKITPESRFKEDLGADSLDLVALFMALDEELKTTLPDDRDAGIVSVNDAVRFIKKYLETAS